MPLAPEKIEKIRALASSSPHDGERAAARAALDRLGLAVERPAPARPRDTSTLFGSRPVEEIKTEATFAFANATERTLAILCARNHGCTAYQTVRKSGKKRTERKKHIVVRGTRADVLAAERAYEAHRKWLRLLTATLAAGYASVVTSDYTAQEPPDEVCSHAWVAGRLAAYKVQDAMEGR